MANVKRLRFLVLNALQQRGFQSVAQWAKHRGFNPSGVHKAIDRWIGRIDKDPHGGLSREIINTLWADLGSELNGEQK